MTEPQLNSVSETTQSVDGVEQVNITAAEQIRYGQDFHVIDDKAYPTTEATVVSDPRWFFVVATRDYAPGETIAASDLEHGWLEELRKGWDDRLNDIYEVSE